jgi:HK97 family phage portal protein
VSWFSRIFAVKPTVVVWQSGATTPTVDPSTLPAVVRAVQLLSSDIARLPVRVERADGSIVEDHPVAQLLTRDASRWQSGFDFRRFVTSCALTSGNGLALIRRSSDGAVAELQPIPVGAARAQWTDDGVEYLIKDVKLAADQVVHLGAYPDLLFPAWFVSPLDAAAHAMQLAADQDAAHSALVKTGSTGKISLSHPGAMSDQAVESIRNAWQTMHATPDGASRPLILREGMKAERISQETSTSNLESRRFSVQEIARAFMVPPEMLFQQGGGALASQAETARAYVDGGLAMWVAAWSAEIERKLLAPGERLRFDVDVLLRGNLKDSGASLSKLVLGGIMAPNDARRRLGLPPIEGLDEPKLVMPGGASAGVGMGVGREEGEEEGESDEDA